MKTEKLECKQHNKTFKGGAGYAAHQRAFHNDSASGRTRTGPAIPRVAKPTTLGTHLAAVVQILDNQISTVKAELATLQQRRDIIAQLGA